MNIGQEKGSLVCANGVIILGKMRFAPNMNTQHSQKGDSDSLWSLVMKSFPPIGCAWAGPLLGTHAFFSRPLLSLSLSRDCFLRSGKVTFHAAILTSVCTFSLLQPLHSTIVVLGVQMGESQCDIYPIPSNIHWTIGGTYCWTIRVRTRIEQQRKG